MLKAIYPFDVPASCSVCRLRAGNQCQPMRLNIKPEDGTTKRAPFCPLEIVETGIKVPEGRKG